MNCPLIFCVFLSLLDSLCLPMLAMSFPPQNLKVARVYILFYHPQSSILGPCLLLTVPSGIVQCFTVFTL